MASGDTLAKFFPGDQEPLSTGFATPDVRNNHLVLDFDDTTDENAYFKDILRNYAGGGLTLNILCAMSTATSGNVVIQAAIERIQLETDDIDSDSFAALNGTGAVAVPGTSGYLKKFTITFTDGADMDSLANGEPYRLQIRRDADDTSATDSASGDMEFWGAELLET